MNRALAASLLAFASLHVDAQPAPPNFVAWRDGLHSSAQPSAAWLAQVKKMGYDVVVNLAPPQSEGSLREEGGIVGASGVIYVNIPVDFGNPTAEDFRVFTEVMKASRGKKVFVHCQVNMRGSAFTFLYRVLHEGAPVGESARQMNGVWTPNPTWKEFIDGMLAAGGKSVVY
ncbi:MAG TPA: protein tyrosine phosphatase family protein [Usitatibacter sp.]|nr:protein tyrosine phosphatase family protein [Usitatibacter sp.]